jgi:hypothetical protein
MIAALALNRKARNIRTPGAQIPWWAKKPMAGVGKGAGFALAKADRSAAVVVVIAMAHPFLAGDNPQLVPRLRHVFDDVRQDLSWQYARVVPELVVLTEP